jgi:sugar transferase (PEP-CTERM system associated)
MIKVFNVYFANRVLLLAASEALLVFSVLWTTTLAGLDTSAGMDFGSVNQFLRIALASLVCILCMYYYDLYDSLVFTNAREAFTRLIQVLGTTSLILALLYHLYPTLGLRVETFVFGISLAGLSVAAWRKLFLVLNRSPRLAERAVLVGGGPLAASLIAEIEKHPEIGIRLIGLIDTSSNSLDGINGLVRLGTLDQLPELLKSRQMRRILITMSDRRGKLPLEMLLNAKRRGIRIQDGADLYEAITGKVAIESLRSSWLLFSAGFQVSWSLRLYKRAFSVLFSFVNLLITLPMMGTIALAILLDSGTPIIFRQERIGKDGRPFTLYKFRSMRDGADGNGSPVPARENDSRFTRVGRWLRRTRLDELPQLYNIMRGEMDFIGPRPFVREQEEECLRHIPYYSQRWSVKPGATGWAQIHRGYCASLDDNREKLTYDLFYIKNLSVGLDLLILFQTVKILLLGRGGR